MCTILHLSDLHLGEKRKTNMKDLLTTKKGVKKLADSISNNVSKKHFKSIKPDCVVITGDLTNTSDGAEYDLLEVFLKKLLKNLEIKKERLLVVPGNHDVSWTKYDDDAKYVAYKQFYKRFFNKTWNQSKPVFIRFKIRNDETIIFGLDSNSTLTKSWSNFGNVGNDQLDNVNEIIDDLKIPNSSLKLFALHHHVLPVYNYYYSFQKCERISEDTISSPPVSLLMNASQLLKRCREIGVAGILHGHAHVPYSVTHSNYLEYQNKGEHIPRSIAVIGSGSPTSEKLDNYKRYHFQIVKHRNNGDAPLFHIHSFQTKDLQPTIDEMEESVTVVPAGIEKIEIPNELISKLQERLYSVILNEYSKSELIFRNDNDIVKRQIYDEVLDVTMNWIESYTGKSFGCAAIAKYVKDLKIYKHIAIYKYDSEVRNFVYPLDENAITIETAKKNKIILVKSRVNCKFASNDRNTIYLKSLAGDDQTCLSIPLNASISDGYPYAVLSLARGKLKQNDSYDNSDIAIFKKIAPILESAIFQAELADIAEKRRNILHLFSWVNSFVSDQNEVEIPKSFIIVVKKIYQYFNLDISNGDKVAIFLPKPPNFENYYCIAEIGFGNSKASNMTYRIGGNEGLTGNLIDNNYYDFCIDHLNDTKEIKSLRGTSSSKKCEKDIPRITDHHLSFVGVPFENIQNEPYSKGAIILNVSTPNGQFDENYILQMYIEPLEIICKLLYKIIEGPWLDYCNNFIKRK